MPICNPDTVGVCDDKIGTLIRTKTCMLEEHLSDIYGLPQHPLSKIKNKDGKTRYDSGSYPKKSCFICRGWVRKYHLTSYQCKTCAMPICNPDTVGVCDDKIGTLIRTKTCMEEQLSAVHPCIKCNGDYQENLQFPVHYKQWTAKNNKKYILGCLIQNKN
jgi:hypothetical protein